MNAPIIFAPPGEVRVAAALAEAVASWDECVLLLGEAGADAVLDRAAHALALGRVRCVRVRAPAAGGLSLRGLMAQVVGRTDPGALSDTELEAGFALLTEPGQECDRVVLMVEGAHTLLPPAVRYIQLACRSGPQLRVVLAGRPGLEGVLVGDEFADLRRRFTRRLALPGSAADGSAPGERAGLFSVAPEAPPETLPALPDTPAPLARLRDAAWTLTKVGLAASLVVWMWRLSSPVPPPPRPPMPDVAGLSDPPGADPAGAGSKAPLAVWTTRWEDAPSPPGAAPLDPDRRADPGGITPSPAQHEVPVAPAPSPQAIPLGSAAEGSVAPPCRPSATERRGIACGDEARAPKGVPGQVPFEPPAAAEAVALPEGRIPPIEVLPPAATDVPDPAAAARGHAEDAPPPAPASAALADGAASFERGAPPATRDEVAPAVTAPAVSSPAASAPAMVDPAPERPQPPTGREVAPVVAGPGAPETPTHGRAAGPDRDAGARDGEHIAARAPEPAATPPAPAPALPPPEAAVAALPLPPIPPPHPPPPPSPRSSDALVPPLEVPATRRARAGVERATAAPAPQAISRGGGAEGGAASPEARVPRGVPGQATAARSDERRCRDLVLKAQLGETLSDAETQFMRGGCRVD